MHQYNLHDHVVMKKQHPCKGESWEIIRLGADIKLKCDKCQHIIMMPRSKFEKGLKKVLKKNEND